MLETTTDLIRLSTTFAMIIMLRDRKSSSSVTFTSLTCSLELLDYHTGRVRLNVNFRCTILNFQHHSDSNSFQLNMKMLNGGGNSSVK